MVTLEDGYRESTESWKTLLRDLKSWGMPAPKLAIANGALGFSVALRDIYPEAEEQRCWIHKIANVLDKLPQRLQSRAKSHPLALVAVGVKFPDGETRILLYMRSDSVVNLQVNVALESAIRNI